MGRLTVVNSGTYIYILSWLDHFIQADHITISGPILTNPAQMSLMRTERSITAMDRQRYHPFHTMKTSLMATSISGLANHRSTWMLTIIIEFGDRSHSAVALHPQTHPTPRNHPLRVNRLHYGQFIKNQTRWYLTIQRTSTKQSMKAMLCKSHSRCGQYRPKQNQKWSLLRRFGLSHPRHPHPKN
jgi:hypothetical protein